MTTVLGGDYTPVSVMTLDLVGYLGAERGFVILGARKSLGRELPAQDSDLVASLPTCIRAKIDNGQVVNFSGEVATLLQADGKWFYKLRDEKKDQLRTLMSHMFFEIGDAK